MNRPVGESPIPVDPLTWSRHLACDLFPGKATPFAWSVLRGPTENALRSALSELGAEIAPVALWRIGDDHHVLINAAALREADDTLSGAAWLGADRPVVRGNFFARMQNGKALRRARLRLAALPDETTTLRERLAGWLAGLRDLRWSQADLLQVMEELEPHATAVLKMFFLARAGLAAATTNVAEQLKDFANASANAGYLYSGLGGLPTVDAAYAFSRLAETGASSDDRSEVLARYGHRGPGEMRPDAVRWSGAAAPLARLAAQNVGATLNDAEARRHIAEADMRSLDAARWRRVEEALVPAREFIRTADKAWDSLMMVMAGTQAWLAAAAREVLAAQLVGHSDDVLFMELEELKQVATGEWHSGHSGEVQAEVNRRRSALLAANSPAPLIATRPISVHPGVATGPAFCGSPLQTVPSPGSVWLSDTADPGAAPFWLGAAAIVVAAPDPWAPGMLAARALGLPTIAGAVEVVSETVSGRQVLVDGGLGLVGLAEEV